MANTRGFEVVAQVNEPILQTIYRDAWKNGGDGTGPGTIPQHITLGPPLAMGPYAVKDGEIVIPETGLGMELVPASNGVRAMLHALISVEIDNPPIPSASMFSLEANLSIVAPVAVLDPARKTVGINLTGLPANAVTASLTSGDPIGPITQGAIAEYVDAQYADPNSGFPRLIEDVPISFTPFSMLASLEIFNDPGNPARKIAVSGPVAGKVTLRLPCRLRFYQITGSFSGTTLASPMASDGVIEVVADYETPPGRVVARLATATAELTDLIAAPGIEGQNWSNNRTLISYHPLHTVDSLPDHVKSQFGPLAQTRLQAIGDVEVTVPSVAEIEAFIAAQVRAELEARGGISIWTPEAPEGSDVTIQNVAPKVLSHALAICINAGPGANANAMTNLIPGGRDFCVAISATKVNAAMAAAIADEFPNGFPHRYNNIEGHDADLRSLSISLRDDDRIRMEGSVTVIDAICKADVDADFTAHVDLRWEDGAEGGQRIVPFQEGDTDIDLATWVYIVSFLVGFIVLGLIGVIIVAVVIAIAESIAGAVGTRVVDEEAGNQFKSISAWPQTLDGIGTIDARFVEAVDIDTGGILSSGSMLVTATFALTSVDQARSKGPYAGAGGAALAFDGGLDRPTSLPRWALGDGNISFDRRPVHTYGRSGLYVAKLGVAVQEDGGAQTRHFAAVAVANVAPVVTAPAVLQVDEGEEFELLASFTDAEWLDRHTARIDWGDNTKPDAAQVSETNAPPQAQGTARARHTYCRSGQFVIRVQVQDEDGGIGEAVVQVRVANVAPVVKLPKRVRTLARQPIRMVGRFTDQGWCDRHTGLWEFGDCARQWAIIREDHHLPACKGTAEAVHIYHACGTQVARLTVRDEADAGTAEMRVEVVELENPGFDSGFHRRVLGKGEEKQLIVGNGWEPFAGPWPIPTQAPSLARGSDTGATLDVDIGPSLFQVSENRRGQAIAVRGGMLAGVCQQVPVNRGWLYEFEAKCDLPAGSGGLAMLGLDPAGGTDPLAAGIVWAERPGSHDWASLAERVSAAGETVTVFLGIRGTSDGMAAIRWDAADLRQIQPLCAESKVDCVPVRVAMSGLQQKRLAEPEALDGLEVRPLKGALPILALRAGGRGVCFGRQGMRLTTPAPVSEMTLEIDASSPVNAEINIFTGQGLARQIVESLPVGRTEIAVRQAGLIGVGLRASGDQACFVSASLCLPEIGEEPVPRQACAEFDGLTQGAIHDGPVTVKGFVFTPEPGASLTVIGWGDPQGVQKLGFQPAGFRINLPFAARRAGLALGLYAGPAQLDAYAGNDLVSTTDVAPANGPVSSIIEGEGLTSIMVRGGGYEAFVAKICIDTEPATIGREIARPMPNRAAAAAKSLARAQTDIAIAPAAGASSTQAGPTRQGS